MRYHPIRPTMEVAVRHANEKEWELTIDPDTVRLFILKAKAIGAALNDDYADGSEHEVELDGDARESHGHDGLAEEEEENLTEEELRELIDEIHEAHGVQAVLARPGMQLDV